MSKEVSESLRINASSSGFGTTIGPGRGPKTSDRPSKELLDETETGLLLSGIATRAEPDIIVSLSDLVESSASYNPSEATEPTKSDKESLSKSSNVLASTKPSLLEPSSGPEVSSIFPELSVREHEALRLGYLYKPQQPP